MIRDTNCVALTSITLPNRVTVPLRSGNLVGVTGNTVNGSVTSHFGRQLRKERRARGWSIHELSSRMGVAAAHLSRIETGKRPPTENIAMLADQTFPERKGWFGEYYRDSRSWMSPGFRDWTELENAASHLSVWCPSIVHGLAQTADYARALLALEPSATDAQIDLRLKARMERQRRILHRDEPPSVRFVVDQAALYRLVGNAEVMTDQMNHLIDLAAMPRVTVQLLPQVGHAASSELIVTADACYVEHTVGGYVYTQDESPEMVTRIDTIMTSIQAECLRASDSATMIMEAIERWNT